MRRTTLAMELCLFVFFCTASDSIDSNEYTLNEKQFFCVCNFLQKDEQQKTTSRQIETRRCTAFIHVKYTSITFGNRWNKIESTWKMQIIWLAIHRVDLWIRWQTLTDQSWQTLCSICSLRLDNWYRHYWCLDQRMVIVMAVDEALEVGPVVVVEFGPVLVGPYLHRLLSPGSHHHHQFDYEVLRERNIHIIHVWRMDDIEYS